MNDNTVTILQKDAMFAVFALDTLNTQTVNGRTDVWVGRYDSRCTPPFFYQTAETVEEAAQILNVNLDISINRGWQIKFQGRRNWG